MNAIHTLLASAAFSIFLVANPAMAQTTPTLVQQLSNYLAYEQAEADEECPGGGCYHYYRAARLTQQLAAAQAAAAAGTPLSPILDENGQVSPLFGSGGSAGIGGNPASRGTK